MKSLFGSETEAEQVVVEQKPFPFLTPVTNLDQKLAHGGGGIEIVDDAALVSATGPLGSIADVNDAEQSFHITAYKVRTGDTLGIIAKMFDISPSTIRWANNIPKNGTIKPGDVLIILPVSGVKHVVVKGDSVASIAKKYGGDPDDIYDFNGLATGESLEIGSTVIIPDGEVSAPPETTPKNTTKYIRGGGPEISGYYARPLRSGMRSRGIHGYNGVDLASACGTPVYASASGTVITARDSGWNGGYGKYIVIAHANGTQTLYAHLSNLNIGSGWSVAQNQQVGLMGTTGKSTGCHLHFEIRGAKNPF